MTYIFIVVVCRTHCPFGKDRRSKFLICPLALGKGLVSKLIEFEYETIHMMYKIGHREKLNREKYLIRMNVYKLRKTYSFVYFSKIEMYHKI